MKFNTDAWFEYLVSEAESLSSQGRVALCASIAERQYPNFEAFARICDVGGSEQLRSCLDDIWEGTLNLEKWDRAAWPARSEVLRGLAPDSEYFSCFLTASAQEAVSCILAAGDICSQPDDLSPIRDSSRAAASSLYFYLANTTLPLSVKVWERSWNVWLDESPLFSEEMNQEVKELTLLKSCGPITTELIRQLREQGRSGIQPQLRDLFCRRYPLVEPR